LGSVLHGPELREALLRAGNGELTTKIGAL
jgi:hypothetical protein